MQANTSSIILLLLWLSIPATNTAALIHHSQNSFPKINAVGTSLSVTDRESGPRGLPKVPGKAVHPYTSSSHSAAQGGFKADPEPEAMFTSGSTAALFGCLRLSALWHPWDHPSCLLLLPVAHWRGQVWPRSALFTQHGNMAPARCGKPLANSSSSQGGTKTARFWRHVGTQQFPFYEDQGWKRAHQGGHRVRESSHTSQDLRTKHRYKPPTLRSTTPSTAPPLPSCVWRRTPGAGRKWEVEGAEVDELAGPRWWVWMGSGGGVGQGVVVGWGGWARLCLSPFRCSAVGVPGDGGCRSRGPGALLSHRSPARPWHVLMLPAGPAAVTGKRCLCPRPPFSAGQPHEAGKARRIRGRG